MNEREVLLKRVQVCDFVLQDVALYLDANPDDKMALRYFKKYNDMRKEAMENYIDKFGPITYNDCTGETRWEWTEHAWPWEREEA